MHTHSVKIENDMEKINLKKKKYLPPLSPVFGVEVDLPMWTTDCQKLLFNNLTINF